MNAAKPIAPRIHSLWRRAPARAIKTHDKYRGNGKQTHDHPALARRLGTRRHVAMGDSRRRQEPTGAKRRRRRNGETRPRHGEGGASGAGAARGGEVATAGDASETVSAARIKRLTRGGSCEIESRSSIHECLVTMFLTLLKGAFDTFKSPENGAPNRRARYRLMAIRSVAIPRMRISMP